MSDPLEHFPCLAHDDESWDLRVCVAPDGHEGEHSFVNGSELMVNLNDDGVHFKVETETVN